MTSQPSGTRTIAVVGASSQIGKALSPRLEAEGFEVLGIGRQQDAQSVRITHVFDAQIGGFTPPARAADCVINLAPLPIIDQVIDMARALGARRIIAFGSSSRYFKADSTAAIEREFARQQQVSEARLQAGCEAEGMGWTLLRPTMIYGAGQDLNISFLAGLIRQTGFFPIPKGACGRRQPVHVDDLAQACIACLREPRTVGRSYDLGGGEQLTYPEMIRRVFLAETKPPRLVPVPRVLMHVAIHLMRRIPRHRFLRKEMVDRMYTDLVVDQSAAVRDFGYAPGGFRPGSNRAG